jgi:predicted DNA-binding protein
MKRITFNIPDENFDNLEKLCKKTERNKTQMLNILIKKCTEKMIS